MLRFAAPVLALAALAQTADAGDHRMVVTGQVLVTSPAPIPGALGATFTIGAPFEIVAEVDDAPLVLTPDANEYPLDTATGGLTINGAQLPYEPGFGAIVISDASILGGDLIVLSSEFQTSTVNMTCGITFSDPTMTALSSPDIAALDGVSFTNTPGQPLGFGGGLQNASGPQSIQVVFDIAEIRFEATGPGGPGGQGIGTPYCNANPNSAGGTGTCRAVGSTAVVDNDVTLEASQLPPGVFGFFLTSQTQGFVANPGGSQGNLCLGGAIGRFVGPGEIRNSGPAGEFSLQIDLTALPQGISSVAAQAGQTWNFAAWYRDALGGAPTSNFTDGVAVAFQ
jgi:hypothetical protein